MLHDVYREFKSLFKHLLLFEIRGFQDAHTVFFVIQF